MLKGIDVSHHNGTVDFAKVKSAGISFAYVKATERTNYVDPMFQPHVYNAMKAGLPVGAYHFGHPRNNPVDEANHFVKNISVFKLNLLPVLDLECAPSDMSADELYNWARTFVNTVRQKTGHQVMLYTYTYFLQKYPTLKKLNDLPLWIASYRPNAPAVSGWKDWVMWQYTSDANIPGVNGRCDASWLKDLNAIMIGGHTMAQTPAQTQNSQILKIGSTGDLVKQLQERLQIAVDGIFGPQTEESVKEWQKAHGLTVDGIVGQQTWNALFPPKPAAPMYRVTADGKFVVDTAYPEKIADAVQNAVKAHAKEVIVKLR